MRSVLCLFILIFTYNAYSQDTIYLNSEYEKIPKDSSFEYFKLIQALNNDTVVRVYQKNGKISSETIYSNYCKGVRNGVSKDWFDNGLLFTEISYENGSYDGFLRTYWPNGKLKRDDNFRKGKFIKGTCFDSSGVKVKHFDYQSKPEFPGGDIALIQYVSEKTKYPVDARNKGIEGKIYIRFVVKKNGEIGETKVINSVDPLLDAEAVRVVKSMPKWKPAYIDGEPVNVWFVIPVIFKLQ